MTGTNDRVVEDIHFAPLGMDDNNRRATMGADCLSPSHGP